MNFAHAHGLASPKLFELKWAFDPTLLLFVGFGLFYARGLRSYASKAPIQLWQKLTFFAGLFVLMWAYLPPIDTVADQLFSAHMLQHLLITSVGIPLMILGAPFLVMMRGLSPRARHIFAPLARQKTFTGPLAAALIYECTFWFWHIPYFYNRALLNDAIHLVEHGCFAIAALNLWRTLLDAPPQRARLAYPSRLGLIGLMMTLDVALSAALTYSREVWYAYDHLPMPAWSPLSRLEDQQLGGLLMWVPGSFVWLAAVIWLFWSWYKEEPG